MLCWDLHLHPAPSSAPRWGDGRRVWEAAREAGVRGFVWKSHEEHTPWRCGELPTGPPHAIGSVSLNPWATLEDVLAALEAGARWIWGSTQDRYGAIGWELPLPCWWPELRRYLSSRGNGCVVLATGHLGREGRETLAAAAAELDRARCSVTHSLYLPFGELCRLARYGCAFEFDAYTYAFPPAGREQGVIERWVDAALEQGCLAYATSDGGQPHTGNPFVFGARVLERLRLRLGPERLSLLAEQGPAALATHVLSTTQVQA